jgi:hypothetical protein
MMKKIIISRNGSINCVAIPQENIRQDSVVLPFRECHEYGLEIEYQCCGINLDGIRSISYSIGLEVLIKMKGDDIGRHSDDERKEKNFYAYGAVISNVKIQPDIMLDIDVCVIDSGNNIKELKLTKPWYWNCIEEILSKQDGFYDSGDLYTTGTWSSPLWICERCVLLFKFNNETIFKVVIE